ncbi:MAG: 23S rRNA (uracil(1939)-C(5))-methyltransferase RlmD [Lachnospiraceae bacterium]|nr:23S rRNA (uracil(1939)-C(5))-methyltransferase RlmD [Lachnospiraceae bacterium]
MMKEKKQRNGKQDFSRQENKNFFQKDMELELLIEDMGTEGEGIGKKEGVAFFVKDAVLGDLVRVNIMKMKKNYGYARLIRVLKPSPYRTEPRCPMYRQCGGCQIQALDYGKQLEFKENKVKNNLTRIGGFQLEEAACESGKGLPVIHPAMGMEEPYHYRNKAQFPIGTDKNGNIVTGFYAARSHTIIPNRNCFLGVKLNEEILNLVIEFMEENGIAPYQETTGTGVVRHVLIRCGFATEEVMVCLVINGRKLPFADKLTAKLQSIPGMTSITLNVNEKNTNVILGDEIIPLWGQNYITDYIGNVKYQISPLSFYQVNPVQTQKLYEKALEYAELTGTETVWDLYCGIGTISLFLAQKAKQVYGVEVVAPAIKDARNNARINGITNVEFFVGKAEEVLPEFYEKGISEHPGAEMLHPDVIVVDPPRKGCDARCLETIVKMQPKRVVYVSCDSATLARDLKYLCGEGYEVREVQPVDMFPQTTHVETVCLLSRKAQ